MSNDQMQMTPTKGGEFLIKDTNAQDVFIPEQWNEEQQMMAETCHDFLEKELYPVMDRIDAQEEVHSRKNGEETPFHRCPVQHGGDQRKDE